MNTVEFYQERLQKAGSDYQLAPGHPDMGWLPIIAGHAKFLNENLKGNETVLDAGCGIGRLAEWFIYYTGVDFVPEFIEEAKRRYPHKTFHCMDVQKPIPFKDKEFDVVIMASATIEPTSELRRIGKKLIV